MDDAREWDPDLLRLRQAMEACFLEALRTELSGAPHVEADAVHEQVVRHEVIGGLLVDDADLEEDIALGCAATVLLEDRLASHIREAWDDERSALRTPLHEHER